MAKTPGGDSRLLRPSALEQDARVSSLWRTPLITLPGPSKLQ